MRIYNGKDSLICLPLNANQRISIDPHSVSGDFLPSTEFITMVTTSFDTDELALIVASSFEINMCATVLNAVSYVVQSLDEAISRFAIPKEEKKEEVKIEEPKEEEPILEQVQEEKCCEENTNCTCEEATCEKEEKVEEKTAEEKPSKKLRKKKK